MKKKSSVGNVWDARKKAFSPNAAGGAKRGTDIFHDKIRRQKAVGSQVRGAKPAN
jgi:hypothetical protein